MLDTMRFWYKRGVAGFRLDAVDTLFEDPELKDNPVLPGVDKFGFPNTHEIYNKKMPEVHDVMREMRKATGMPIGLPAFAWMVRLGAPLLMHTDPELALYGRYLISERLRDEGFNFRFPELSDALADLFSPSR